MNLNLWKKGMIESDVSDHFLIFFSISLTGTKRETVLKIGKWVFNEQRTLMLVKIIGGDKSLSHRWERYTCLFMSGLNDIFQWQAHLLIFTKFLFVSILLVSKSLIFENSDVSSANILHIDFKPSG